MARPWSLGRSLSISFLIHLGLLLAWAISFGRLTSQRGSLRRFKVELTTIPKQADAQMRAKTRLVQSELAEKSKIGKDSAFLGKQNQSVDRETVSRTHGTRMGDGKATGAFTQNQPRLSQLGLQIVPKEPNSPLRLDQPQWATPGLKPEDFVAGMRESDRTALNTKEFLYYSYYQRIRSRLEQAWYPLIKVKVENYYRSGRRLASDYEHTTKVLVILNRKGEVIRVRVLESSGTFDLDTAAVAAFNEAGPFPNPPVAMLGTREEIEIPWDFVLKS